MAQPPQRNLPPESTQWAKWVERRLEGLGDDAKNNARKISRVQSSQQHALSDITNVRLDQETNWDIWELEREAIVNNIEEQLNDPQRPIVPEIDSVTSEGYWDDAGQPRANATVTWLQVYEDEDEGQLLDITNYEVKLDGLIEYVQGIPIDEEYEVGEEPETYNSVTLENLPANTELSVSIRAMGVLGGESEWSEPYLFTTAEMPMTLLPPTMPTFRTENGAVEVVWDGRLEGDVVPPTYFAYGLVQSRKQGSGSWTEYGQDAGWVLTGLTAGDVYEARLIAVDTLGRRSEPSAVGTVTVKSAVQDALDFANEIAEDFESEKERIQEALDSAYKAEGGVSGALAAISTLDERLTPQLESVQTLANETANGLSTERDRVTSALDQLHTAQGGIQGALNSISDLDTRLSNELSEARQETEKAATDATTALQQAAKNLKNLDVFYTVTTIHTGWGVALDGTSWPVAREDQTPTNLTIVGGVPTFREGANTHWIQIDSKGILWCVERGLSAPPVTPTGPEPTSEWTNAEPFWAPNNIIWWSQRTILSDDTVAWSTPIRMTAYDAAADALMKANSAVSGTTLKYAVGTAIEPTGAWQSTPPTIPTDGYMWQQTTVTYGSGETEVLDPIRVTGNRGKDGLPGKEGVGIEDTDIEYAKSASGTTAPNTGWQPQPPTPTKGWYLWTRTIWTYTDGTTETGYSTSYWATDGASGADGLAGKDGVGITNTTITYAQSTSGTVAPTTGWQSQPPSPIAGRYVWTKAVWTYSDNTTETGYSVGKIGDTGEDGKGIEIAGSVATYANLPTNLTLADAGKGYLVEANGLLYIWDGTHFPTVANGVEFRGPQGTDGIGIEGLVPYWRYVNAGAAAPAKPTTKTASGWSTSEPAADDTKDLYRVERIDYTDGSWQWTSVQKVASFQVAKEAMTVAANLRSAVEAGLMRFAKASAPPAPFKGGIWAVLDEATGSKMVGLRNANSAGTAWVPYQIIVEDLMVVGTGGTIQLKNNVVTAGTIQATNDMKAKFAQIIDLEANTAAFNSAVIKQSFISSLIGNDAFVKTLVADRILVASDNLEPDPYFDVQALWGTSASFEMTDEFAFPGHKWSQRAKQAAAGASNRSLYSVTMQGPIKNTFTPVEGGQRYVARAWWYADTRLPADGGAGYSTQVYFYDSAGTMVSGGAGNQDAGARVKTGSEPLKTWFETGGGVVTAPADACFAAVRPTIYFNTSGSPNSAKVYLGKVELRPQVGSILLENEAVTAPKLDVTEAMKAKFAEIIELEAHTAKFDNAIATNSFIENLISKQSFITSLYSNQIVVAPTDWAPYLELVWDFKRADWYNNASDPTGRALRLTPTASGAAWAAGPIFPVQPKDKISVRCYMTYTGTVPSGTRYVQMRFMDKAGTWTSVHAETLTSSKTTATVDAVVDVPANAVKARFRAYCNAGTGAFVVRNLDVRTMTSSVLIQDGAITSLKIKAKSIEFEHMKGGALDAFTITSPIIQSVQTASRGIKWNGATLIGYTSAGAEAFRLDGTRATITAGTIQTAKSGARVVLDASGLKAYNASGTQTTTITGATGSISGWSISGSTITGGTIRTATSGQRIQINSAGLRAYNAAGTVTASILSGVGSFTGASMNAPDITGGTITGAVIQTIATANRGVKITSAGIQGWNSSGTQMFSVSASTGLVYATGGTFKSASGTARVELNSTGLKAYNSSGTLTSSIKAGSGSFTGATITGGTIQTVSTANRGVKITSAGLQGWNNSGVLSAKISADGTDNLLVGRLYTSSPGSPGMIISKTSAGLPGIWFSSDGTTSDKHAAIYADDTYSIIFRGTTTGSVYARPVAQGLTVLGPTTTTGSSYALVNVLQKNGRNPAVRIGWANPTGTLGEVWSNDVIANGRLQDFNAPTTTSAANVYMNPTSGTNQGRLYRSTSVRAAKVDIQDVGTDPNRLLDVPVRDWMDRTQLEDYTNLLEEHALHKAGVRDEPLDEKPKFPKRIPGVVAEEIEAAGLEEFCTYDDTTGELVGVMYDRIPLLLIPIVREQRDTIARLEQRISALGG